VPQPLASRRRLAQGEDAGEVIRRAMDEEDEAAEHGATAYDFAGAAGSADHAELRSHSEPAVAAFRDRVLARALNDPGAATRCFAGVWRNGAPVAVLVLPSMRLVVSAGGLAAAAVDAGESPFFDTVFDSCCRAGDLQLLRSTISESEWRKVQSALGRLPDATSSTRLLFGTAGALHCLRSGAFVILTLRQVDPMSHQAARMAVSSELQHLQHCGAAILVSQPCSLVQAESSPSDNNAKAISSARTPASTQRAALAPALTAGKPDQSRRPSPTNLAA